MKAIHTLEDLEKARKNKKSVFCPNLHCWEKCRPAAFLINLQGSALLNLFRAGMYIYEKEQKCQNKTQK